MAVVPRVKAIVNYREGNVALLNAGLHDIEEATDARRAQMDTKRHKLINTSKRIASYEKELEDLKNMERITKNPEEKEKIAEAIAYREACLLKLEARYAETSREEVDSVSTDAISMSQHDKANKSNITKIGMTTFTQALAENFAVWLESNEKEIKIIAEKAINAKKAREAAKKARDAARGEKKKKEKETNK